MYLWLADLKIEQWLNKESTVLVFITGFLGAFLLLDKQIRVIARKVTASVSSIRKFLHSPRILLEKLEAQDKILAAIKSQVYPNGGGSIADKLDLTLRLAQKADRRSLVLTERAQIAVYECDSEGSCVFVNSILARLFGMERSEMLGRGWLKAVDSEDKNRVHQSFLDAIRNKIPYSSSYTIINQKTGERIKCFASAEVTRGLKDEVVFIHGVVEVENDHMDIR